MFRQPINDFVIENIKCTEYESLSSFDFSDGVHTAEFEVYNFTIFHCNIRSYMKHIDELMLILNSFKFKFDIIVMTETWMDESGVIEEMCGYDVVVNKKSRNQNDGVIVYARKNLAVSCEEVCLHGATSMRVDVTFGSERHSVLAVYRSPSPDLDLELFIDNLESYCAGRPRDRTHWLVGDINCCILAETQHPLSQRYLDVLYGAGFVSGANVPTRVTSNTSSCIDHIFTDCLDLC